MSKIDALGEALALAMEEDASETLVLVTTLFVSMIVGSVDALHGDSEKDIQITGGPRKITIHAAGKAVMQ